MLRNVRIPNSTRIAATAAGEIRPPITIYDALNSPVALSGGVTPNHPAVNNPLFGQGVSAGVAATTNIGNMGAATVPAFSAAQGAAAAAGMVGGAAAAGAVAGTYPDNPFVKVMDGTVNLVGTGAGILGFGALAPLAIGAVGAPLRFGGKVSKFGAMERLGQGILDKNNRLQTITNAELTGKISPKWGDRLAHSDKTIGGAKVGAMSALHTITHGAWIAGSAVGVYGVARDFTGQLAALKQMDADLTGRDVKTISTAEVLLGSVPKPVAAARKILLMTEGAHGLAHAAGLLVNIKSLKNPHAFSGFITGMIAYQAPDMIASAVDNFVGDSILPIYKGLSDAHKAGQPLPPRAYGEFLMLSSNELKNRGNVGAQFAMKLGEQYAAEKASPAQVLKEISNGAMQKRIDAITAAAPSHVDKTANRAAVTAAQPVVGKHTKNVVSQAQLDAMQPPTHTVQ